MKKTNDLTQGSIVKGLVNFFLPIAAGTIFQQFYNAVDAIIVGKYVGTVALAAVGGSSANIINLIICFFISLAGGASVIIAQFYGAKDSYSMSRATGTAVAFCIVTGLVLSVVCIYMTEDFLIWLSSPAETIPDAAVYLRIYFAGSVFVLLFNIESGILRAVGDSRSPFVFLVICCGCNIVLDLVFVICFSMGVAGVAYATVISQIISVLFATLKLRRADSPCRLEWKYIRFDGGLIRKMMHIGIPAAMQQSMFGISNMILQVAVNHLGTTMVAAWSLSGKVDGFYWAVAGAAGTAVTNFAGQNYGANRLDRVREGEKQALRLFLILTLILSGLILTAGRLALPLFTDDPAVVAGTWTVMLYIVPFYFIWTYIEIISGVLRGVGDVVAPVIICVLGICVLRIIWVMTVYRMYPTVESVTLSYSSSWIVTAIAFFIYFKTGKWQRAYSE